jgi:predicted RNase H-like HicB family nuclease/post-segregation antitoxin (ccd killing protein)
MKLCYPAVFYPYDEDEGSGFTVDVVDFLGCISQGDTLTEAILMGAEAACGWIRTNIDLGRPIPPPSPLSAIKPDEGEYSFVSLLLLDLEEHERKYGEQLTKAEIEVELPAYLVTFAKEQQIDVSDAVQSHLTKKFREYHEMDEREKDIEAIEAEPPVTAAS